MAAPIQADSASRKNKFLLEQQLVSLGGEHPTMNANQELLQKLRRQRLRMGEDDLPAPTAAQSATSHTPTRMVQERHQGDLQSKLNRQRQRMGESSQPLEKEKPAQQVQTQPVEAHVKVKQRAMSFLSGRTSSGRSAKGNGPRTYWSLWAQGVPRVTPRPSLVKTPGRINLCSWEDKCRVKSVKSSYTKRLQETEEVDLLPTSGLESGSSLATINEEERRNRQGAALAMDADGTCAEALGDDPQEGSLDKENWSKVEADSGPAKDRSSTPCRCAVDEPELHLNGTSLLCRILVKKHQ
eukprot:Skav222917  [mRNA]  locus=scaffold1489:268400:273659:+ [translate_table: standard]